MPAKYYAIRVGRKKGVFRTWAECQSHVSGFSGAKFKSFRTLAEANAFVQSLMEPTKLAVKKSSKLTVRKRSALATSRKQTNSFGSANNRSHSQVLDAKDKVRAELDAVPETDFIAFTDGACKRNPGPAGSGAYVRIPSQLREQYFNGHDEDTLRFFQPRGTNSTAELHAVRLVLERLEIVLQENESVRLHIFTDSTYVINMLQRNFKAKTNAALIKSIKQMLKRFGSRCRLYWVAAHCGIEWNERADQIANEAIQQGRRRASTPE
ncbi:MAG: hypothetical protein MHM6MM_000350 [Cercozoa sp. M6MM]